MTENTVKELTTRTLISNAQSGDRAAFEALVTRYEEPLRESLRSRIGPHLRSRLDVEDLLQEAFLRALQSISHFKWRDESAFLRWLRAIGENRIRDALKGPRGQSALELPGDVQGRGVSASRGARRDERFERLEESLAHLSPEYRQVILLSRIEGLKIKEVARRMNRSENAVKILLSRALRKLKSTFGDTESLHLPDRALGTGEVGPDEH